MSIVGTFQILPKITQGLKAVQIVETISKTHDLTPEQANILVAILDGFIPDDADFKANATLEEQAAWLLAAEAFINATFALFQGPNTSPEV